MFQSTEGIIHRYSGGWMKHLEKGYSKATCSQERSDTNFYYSKQSVHFVYVSGYSSVKENTNKNFKPVS